MCRGTTPHYTYGDSEWPDKLTAYDGVQFTYDEIGNPLTYYNGNSYEFTWESGRQLASAVVNGDDRVSFEYNADGIRTEKTLMGEYTEKYLLDGDKVVEIVRQGFEVDDRCVITYDESGNPFSFEYYSSATDTTPDKYYYVFNLQGDVIQLRTADGTVIANYTYDAWGKPVSVTGTNFIANRNPLRYRGYFYDTETGLYYCKSRYYDPEVKRFINADAYMSTGQGFLGFNMFAYCQNNPVVYSDPSGMLRGPGYVNGTWCRNPDRSEFGADSDTYQIILDLTARWYAADSQSERERLHLIAEDARRLARAGTPYMYGNDVIMNQLHANSDYAKSQNFNTWWFILLCGSKFNADIKAYSWFVNMTCSEWDYKYNSSWQVPYSYFNGQNMNVNNNKNWVPWIYFEGDVMGADKFGNLNLGYVGTTMGFSKPALLNAFTSGSGDGKYVEWGIALAKSGR